MRKTEKTREKEKSREDTAPAPSAGAGRRFSRHGRERRAAVFAGDAVRAETKRGVRTDKNAVARPARRADARGRSPGASLGAPSARADASATLSGWNAAGRRVDRRSPRCVGTVASRGRFRALPRGRPRFHRAHERRARTPSVAELFPRFVLASYLGRSHSTEVHGGSCSVFSAGKRDGSRSSRRAVRSARESQTNVVCADVVNSACTEVRRAGGSARWSRDGASTPRTDLERDVLDRAFAQFPEPSIFVQCRFQPRMGRWCPSV